MNDPDNPFGGLFGDPEDMQRRLSEFAEQMQGAQRVAWADNAIKLAVDMTVAAIQRLDFDGSADEQAAQVRDAIRLLFPEAVTLVREAQQFKDKLAVVFVINRKIVNTAIGRDVASALAQFPVPVSAVSLGQRVIYAESAARGLSVIEVDSHSEAAKETRLLARTLAGGPPVDKLAREQAA